MELISIEMHGVVVHSVYKTPNEKCVLPALGHGTLPHSTTWGYTNTDDNGEAVEQWADSCNLTLIHNAKLVQQCKMEERLQPHLIFVSESIANLCGKSVMDPIPHTQHRPISARVNPVFVAHPTPFRRRFYLRKADWAAIQQNSINLLNTVKPSQKTMVGSSTRYVWLQEGIFHDDVEQTIYPVYQKNQRACMKSTRNNMQATLFTMVPYILVMHLCTT